MPPVGQKRTCGNGPASALQRGDAARRHRRKELHDIEARASAAISSDAVCTPGRNGRSLAGRRVEQLGRRAGAHGEARAEAPRGLQVLRRQNRADAEDRLGHCLAMALAASGAAGVRSVISSAGRPPATSARASGTPSSARSMVITGMIGRGAQDLVELRAAGICAVSLRRCSWRGLSLWLGDAAALRHRRTRNDRAAVLHDGAGEAWPQRAATAGSAPASRAAR